MKRGVEWFLGILGVLVIAMIVFPIVAPAKHGPRRSPCLSNLKQSSVAMLMYLSDEDERFPPRDGWIDASYPYVKNWATYHCPQVLGTQWGYAFNGALDRANEKKLKFPERVPMLYDSVNPIKNASDLVTSLPVVPRHRRNFMSYADGHARGLVQH